MPVPRWVEGRTWYQIHALRATGAPDVAGDPSAVPTGRALSRVVGWLDHVAGLGCGGVLLTPIAASSTHGYDTVDPFRLDPRLGDDHDFDQLVRACLDRDLRLLLDGVFNHVGRGFPRFVDVLEHGRASDAAGWFRLDFDGTSERAANGDQFSYRDFEGHRELVALDHRSSAVLTWATDVANHWLDRGADGWRFDVAYAVPPTFWSQLSERVLDAHPDAFLFGEMIHGDYAAFVSASGLHSVTQYELHKACWSSCNDRNLYELAWALDRHAVMCRTFVPVTFLGNHDVSRVLSLLRDPRHLGLVLAVLFTVPGSPCIYYGDELGARGVKGTGATADHALRPSLDGLLGEAGDDADEVLLLHRDLVRFRRERPWLTDAAVAVGEVRNERLTFDVAAGDRGVRVVLDLDGSWSTEPTDGWEPVLGAAGWSILERSR